MTRSPVALALLLLLPVACSPGAAGKPCNTNVDCTSGNCQSNVCS